MKNEVLAIVLALFTLIGVTITVVLVVFTSWFWIVAVTIGVLILFMIMWFILSTIFYVILEGEDW